MTRSESNELSMSYLLRAGLHFQCYKLSQNVHALWR